MLFRSPVAGILIAPHIKPKHFQLGTTFGGNHLACAAALGVLEVIEKENLIQQAASMGDYIQKELKLLHVVENVRGRGLMIGFDVPASLGELKKKLLWEEHIFTGEAKPNVIRLLPSLALTQADAARFITSVKKLSSPQSH